METFAAVKEEGAAVMAQAHTPRLLEFKKTMDALLKHHWRRLTPEEQQDLYASDPETCWALDAVWVMEFIKLRHLTEAQEVYMDLAIAELHAERDPRYATAVAARQRRRQGRAANPGADTTTAAGGGEQQHQVQDVDLGTLTWETTARFVQGRLKPSDVRG